MNQHLISIFTNGTTTRIFSRIDYIEFYDKYFFKHEILRKDLENSHITPVERSYILCTDFHWIQVAVIGFLITNIFFKYTVDIAVHIFYMQLCVSLSTLFFSESEFIYRSSLRPYTTKVSFK